MARGQERPPQGHLPFKTSPTVTGQCPKKKKAPPPPLPPEDRGARRKSRGLGALDAAAQEWIGIVFPFAPSRFGMWISSTPFLKSARMRSLSMVLGSAKERVKLP